MTSGRRERSGRTPPALPPGVVFAVRAVIVATIALCACRDSSIAARADGPDAQAGGPACTRVVPTTDAGSCPVMPPNGILCDLTEVASGLCGAPGCPSNACHGCSSEAGGACFCGYGGNSVEVCFPLCESSCDPGQPPQNSCLALGSCVTAADCQGALPHICQNCPLSPQGEASDGCAHWVCNAGQCEVGYCKPGLSCQAGLGCPSYYLAPVDRSCTNDGDCVLVDHTATCCLSIKTAVNRSAQATFAELQRQCAATHDPSFFECGCQGTIANELGASPGPGQSFAAACIGGACTAVVSGLLQCGAGACDAGQSCCVSPDANGVCTYSCADACPLVLNDAGALSACRGSP